MNVKYPEQNRNNCFVRKHTQKKMCKIKVKNVDKREKKTSNRVYSFTKKKCLKKTQMCMCSTGTQHFYRNYLFVILLFN